MTDPTVFLVDRVVVAPGKAEQFVEAYLRDYAPGATDRGMALDRVLVSPPVWTDEEPTTVTATWALAGPAGVWRAAIAVRHDPEPSRWWDAMGDMIVHRERSMAADHDVIAALSDV